MSKRIPNIGQIKYLGHILTKKEKEIIISLFFIALLSFSLLVGRIYFLKSEIIPTNGGKYIEGFVGAPRLINPILAGDDIDLTIESLIFSGLLKYDKNLGLAPDLIEDMPTSDDQKTYAMCLKQNLFWHDGEELTLDDVIFTYDLIKNQIFKNPFLERLKQVEVLKINDNCLKFNLEKTSSTFLSDLTLGILPKHIWEKIELDKFSQSEFNIKPIGSGAFKFSSLAKNDSGDIKFYTLERNEKFYNKKPYLEEITFKFYPNFIDAINSLKTNQINGLGYYPKGINDNLIEITNLKHYQFNLPYYMGIFFNLKSPVLKGKAVRNALAYLTPKEQIFTSVFKSEGIIIHGPILPHSFAFNPDIKQYEYNPELAKKILIDDGWQKNSKDIWEKNGNVLEISITTIDQPDFKQSAELIQKAWQEIGIFIKLIIVPSEQIREIIVTRNFQTFLYGILGAVNSNPYSVWHSSQINPPGINLTGFNNRRVNELLEKAALTDDREAQKKYYYEFQEIISKNLPAIFLYNPTYSYLVDKKIKGIDIARLNQPEDRFIGIENWYIKTKRTLKKE